MTIAELSVVDQHDSDERDAAAVAAAIERGGRLRCQSA
jgi:hypothetical protein